MTNLYAELNATRHAISRAYDAMIASPCDATIAAYESALDEQAQARLAISAAYEADMAARDIRSCRKAV
jgi:hypothetical protein